MLGSALTLRKPHLQDFISGDIEVQRTGARGSYPLYVPPLSFHVSPFSRLTAVHCSRFAPMIGPEHRQPSLGLLVLFHRYSERTLQ